MIASIRKPILMTFITAITLLVVVVGVAVQWMHRTLEDIFLQEVQSISSLRLQGMQQEAGHQLEGLVAILQMQEDLSQAFVARDRGQLLQQALPFYRQFEKFHGINGLSFLKPDRHVLLRVHHPEAFDDLQAHEILLNSEKTGVRSQGLRVTSSGDLLLCVVVPWRDPMGKLMGYVAVDLAIHSLLQSLEQEFQARFLVFIEKKWIIKEQWERLAKIKSLDVPWNRFADVVMMPMSHLSIPAWLDDDFLGGESTFSPQANESWFFWLEEHEHFEKINLQDHSGVALGWIGIIADDTQFDSVQGKNLLLIMLAILSVTAFMIIVFNRRLISVDQTVARSVRSLAKSEARYSAILDTAMDAIVSIDKDGIVLEYNRAAEATFGFSYQEMMGTRFSDSIIPDEMRDKHDAAMKHYLASGQSHFLSRRVELPAMHKDGRRLDIELAITVVSIEEDVFFTAFLRDISQKKADEGKLRLQAAALEAAANPIVITDVQSVIQWINPAFTKLTGFPAEEVIGQKPSILKSGEHDSAFYESMWDTILAGEVWHHEVVNKKKDGVLYVQESVITPVRDASGRIRHFIAIQQDVTDKKRIENERNRFWLAVEQSPVTTVITDPQGLIEYVNPQFCRVTGYAQHEVIGNNPRMLKTESTPELVYSDMWQTIASGNTWRGELLNRKKSGDSFWESTLIAPIFNDKGKIQHYLAIKEDITEKKVYDAALREARQKADAASRAKSEFLATMSHEIRTPMNGILGMVELLLDGPLNQQQYHYAQTVYRSGESLLSLLNDILDFSRIEASQVILEHTSFDLRELLAEVADVFSPLAHSKSLPLSIRWTPESMWTTVLGDPVRLRQIMINLAGNAVKFTHNGGVSLHIMCLSESPAGNLFRFEVVDTGIGIDGEAQKRLFQPFVQADSTTTRRYGGSGLGLSIVRKLVELMGGRVGLESVPGQGSTFWFEVTLELDQTELAGAARKDQGKREISKTHFQNHNFSGLRILVAEDFEVNRDVIMGMLGRLGCHAHWAEHGRKAVEMAAAFPYDLILMDMHMPEMDGFTATAHIRQQEGLEPDHPHIPIIAITADAMSGDREKCLAAGLDDYIAKPFRSRDLIRILNLWGTKVSQARSQQSPPVVIPEGSSQPVAVALEKDAALLPIVDPEELSRLQSEVGDEIGLIIKTFLHVLPERIRDILASSEDPVTLANNAHRLKGGARTLGALRLADLCQRLEKMAKTGNIDAVAPLMDELRESAQHTEIYLGERFKGG
ncbi:MAG: PAS domain S-box protein [Magnetococcus sp. THC-1_WYH]